MTGIDSVQLRDVIVHKVGNPTRSENLVLSENALTLNDELVKRMLTKYFLSSFNENEHYHFTHLSDLNLNEVFTYVTKIFEDPSAFVATSALLANFLHSKSTHARVKEGELYIALFDQVPLGTEYKQAIGIFKSENKENFLKVFTHGRSLEVISEEGININKLDKGCLVFRNNKEEGYTVCVVDSTNKKNEAQYWVSDFLQVEPYADSYHNTDKYLGLCKQFITNEYAEKFEISKSDQIDLLNRSMDYFKTKDQFSLDEFAEEVIHHADVVDTFKEYKKTYESVKNFEIEDEFDINLSAVKKQAKIFKAVLKLDRNFHIYIHGRKDLIEKGYDELTGKHFYKLFYDEES
ncbi:nucleoid-associated protein [Segetibacter aerophilus]|uniref:Nucleoid-associated protein n=1 Tax=Segetibacter aerophilus TaxID=670293 RepID=A0A512BCG9_9BACT|nr:nucleoid-associated protein [Segetibacter aerophilus]GEO09650.1 hypothetical protein SAE01_21460 [Segetibacter aerophilus]